MCPRRTRRARVAAAAGRGAAGGRGAAAALGAAIVGVLVAPGAPAWAHPFGPPPTATVAASESTVEVAWTAEADDLLLIGERLGYLPPGTAAAALEGAVQVAPSRADAAALDAAPELHAYLLDRIAVRQDGLPCDGRVDDELDFVTEGARLAFRCPAPVTVVELEVTMLTDVNPAYRTFAVSADPGRRQEAVLTAAAPAARWDTRGGAGPAPGRVAAAGGALLLAAAGAGAALWRSRRGSTRAGRAAGRPAA